MELKRKKSVMARKKRIDKKIIERGKNNENERGSCEKSHINKQELSTQRQYQKNTHTKKGSFQQTYFMYS